MRTIKFRGKERGTGKWFYGNLYAKDTYGRTHICTPEQDCLDIDPETVGQFIGLYDKDDKEIYEGDILDFNGIKVEVRFVRGVFAFLENGDLDRELCGDCRTDLFAKVIGNVYEGSESYHINLKYKLTNECIKVENVTLYRIEALKDFADVKNGDKGGFIESENNLSQIDDCWIYGNAKVCQDARVSGNAKVCDHAVVCGYAHVYGNAKVYENAYISGNTKVYENAEVYGDAAVYGNAKVYGNTKIYDYASVCDNSLICGDTKIYDYASIHDNSLVYGNTEVYDYASICGDAVVASNSDYKTFKNLCSIWKYFTWTRSNNMWRVDCFYGTGKELIDKVHKDSKLSSKEYERIVKCVESILKDEK